MAPTATASAPQTVNTVDPDASDYDSSADSDFAGSLSASSSESETERKAPKRKAQGEGVDSGDEGVIEEGSRKRRRKKKGKENEEEEGVGLRLRKRKEGHTSAKDKKPIINTEAVTVDVDALWARLNSAPTAPAIPQPLEDNHITKDTSATAPNLRPEENPSQPPNPPSKTPTNPNPPPTTSSPSTNEETISIERTYTFAGQTITESHQVPKSSASARLYLQQRSQQSQPPTSPSSSSPSSRPPLRRPKKRTSMFEPAVGAGGASSAGGVSPAPKLNTIEKSKMDWAGYVDREGIKEELDGAGKAKEGYLGRMDFLGRVDEMRERGRGEAKRR